MKDKDDERWLDGRTRPVRVFLTEEEHAIVRAAAARADKSVSRYSIEAIVEAAKKDVDLPPAEPVPTEKATEKVAYRRVAQPKLRIKKKED